MPNQIDGSDKGFGNLPGTGMRQLTWNSSRITRTDTVHVNLDLGYMLDGRYLMEHKVGNRRFSTVWMVHDLRDRKVVVALRIVHGCINLPSGKSSVEHQVRIHAEIRQIASDGRLKEMCDILGYIRGI